MQSPDHLAVWLYLILNAAHKPKQSFFGGKERTLNTGQLVTGRKKIAKTTNVHESKVQRVLKLFQNCHQIEQQTNSVSRLITILNYGRYQKVNSNRTTNEQQVNTILYKDEQLTSNNKQKEEGGVFENSTIDKNVLDSWNKLKKRFNLDDNLFHAYWHHIEKLINERWPKKYELLIDRFLKDDDSRIRDLRYLCEQGIDKYANFDPAQSTDEDVITYNYVCPEQHQRRTSEQKDLWATCTVCRKKMVIV